MVYSNTRARCSQATRPHEEMAIYNISATTRGRSSPLPRSRDSATSRERPAGSGLVAMVMAHALLGVVRAVSSGDMLVVLVFLDPSHQKRNVWCFPGSCRAPWGSHNHVVSVRKLLALNSKCVFTVTCTSGHYTPSNRTTYLGPSAEHPCIYSIQAFRRVNVLTHRRRAGEASVLSTSC